LLSISPNSCSPSGWAGYDRARPGSFQLISADAHLAELRSDYRSMAVMIHGEIPDFDQIVDTLRRLEHQVYRLAEERQ